MNQLSTDYSVKSETTFVSKVLILMSLGLVISAVVAFIFGNTPELRSLVVSPQGKFTALGITALLIPFAIVLIMGFVKNLGGKTSLFLFLFLSSTMGTTLSVIFLVYTIGSIVQVLFISAAMFMVFGAYGYFTKRNLTSIGNILFMALIGIVIASVFNIFMHNQIMDFVISIVGVIVFVGLTAHDMHKIKESNGTEVEDVVSGALTLYLDFINLFLFMLRLFGGRK